MRLFFLCLFYFTVTYSANAETIKTKLLNVEAQEIVEIEFPWGMAQLPSGKILVTQKSGKLWLVDPDQKSKTEITGIRDVAVGGQSGLLDIAIAPDFETSKTIFFSFGKIMQQNRAGTAIAKATLVEGPSPSLANYQVIFEMNNPTRSGQHFGSRIVIADDNTLFFTIGDRGEQDRAQDPKDHAGSVLRINLDGSIPKDNPFMNSKTAAPEIWSFGHRNPQGAAIDPITKKLFTVEHGARGGDEINIPEAGKNYGWPVISYGRHYSGQKIGVGTKKEGMQQPLFYWDPSIAPSGMAFHTGNQFSPWKGDLFVGALKDRKLVRLTKNGDAWAPAENMFEDEFGRIRDVRFFKEGNMWLLTDEPDGKLIKITPAQ